jgi:hypothetical protein
MALVCSRISLHSLAFEVTTMNKTLRIGLVTLCCAFAVWATADISARAAPPAFRGHGALNGINGRHGFGPGIGFAGGWGGWGGGLFGFELNGNENRIPYYALFPPVYYSYPIARPYGDSPFASPPGYYGPGAEDGGPKTIVNPYAEPGGAAPPNAAPSNPAPVAPAPTSRSPNDAKPTAGRTASLLEQSSPSVESLPSPEPISLAETGSSAASNVRVVLNPFVQ